MIRAYVDNNTNQDVMKLRALLAQCDPTRKICVFVRKSQKNDRTGYLHAQEGLDTMLMEAGAPREQIIVIREPDGTSGWLGRKYRAGLQQFFDLLGDGVVGTVVLIDLARLHRDYTEREPANFASRMGKNNVSVVTKIAGAWDHLAMGNGKHSAIYLEQARIYAKERLHIRDRTMAAKRQWIMDGGASGGGAAPVGWYDTPGKSKYENPDGMVPALRHIYPAHAEIKLRIMRLSLRPDIKNYAQLRRAIIEAGLVIPPFPPEMAPTAFPRSSLGRVFRKTANGLQKIGMDESVVPGPSMLESLLLEPLALGDVAVGSGDTGAYMVQQMEEMAEVLDQKADCLITPYKQFVRNAPDQAICNTPELRDLYFAVARKWSKIDMERAHNSEYRDIQPNPYREIKLDRKDSRTLQNPWAGFVYCFKHLGEDGKPDLLHRMQLGGDSWRCREDHFSPRACSLWADDNRLGRILDAHLRRGLHLLLSQNTTLLHDIFAQRDAAKVQAARMVQEIAELEEEKTRRLEQLAALQTSLAGLDADFVKRELERFAKENVRPIMESLAQRQKDKAAAEAEGLLTDADKTEEEIRRELHDVYCNWDRLSFGRKKAIITLLVNHVGVITGDLDTHAESIIYFRWAGAREITDVLVGWRTFRDSRPWTAEEDEVLRECWTQGVDYDAICARLQPGRKYWTVRHRVQALRLCTRGSRVRPAGEEEAIPARELSWGERNPDLLYYLLSRNYGLPVGGKTRYNALAHHTDGTVQRVTVETEVRAKMQIVLERYTSGRATTCSAVCTRASPA